MAGSENPPLKTVPDPLPLQRTYPALQASSDSCSAPGRGPCVTWFMNPLLQVLHSPSGASSWSFHKTRLSLLYINSADLHLAALAALMTHAARPAIFDPALVGSQCGRTVGHCAIHYLTSEWSDNTNTFQVKANYKNNTPNSRTGWLRDN